MKKLIHIIDNLFYKRQRNAEVEQINARSHNKSISALARDQWLLRAIEFDYKNTLSKEQIDEIKEFWKPYEFAYKNDYNLQAMYSAISGQFDPSYSGFGLQRHLLASFWNHETFKIIGDKNFTPLFFPGVKMPKTLLFSYAGEYLDENRLRVSYQEAIDILEDKLKTLRHGEAIIKPSDGGEGKHISFMSSAASRNDLEKTIKSYNFNFICQEVIKNHKSFSDLYDKSLNTLRMCTVFWKGKAEYAGAVLRMGTTQRVDNWSQGGIACGVNPDGALQKYAFTEKGELVTRHPSTNTLFENHQLYRFPEAIQLVKRLHAMIPQQKYISWDITVDEDGDLELIELNSPGSHELLEMAGYNGYVNKTLAKEIFDKYLIESFYYDKAVFDWNYREFNDHISLRQYYGNSKVVHIPSQIDGKPVSIVYAGAINNIQISEIHVPRSVNMNPNACTKTAKDCKLIIHN